MIQKNIAVAFCSITVLIAWSTLTMARPVEKKEVVWFQKEIKELLKLDQKNPPPKHPVVFTGSSIFRFWSTLERDMAPLPVVNRSFGGARTWEILHYLDSIILPLKPSLIVYYCGGNDLECGATAAEIAGRFARFCSRILAALPQTGIIYVSLNKAPQKFEKWALLDEVNRLAALHCATDARLGFVDINPSFVDAAGMPRRELYISDGLHFMPDAYKLITAQLKPEVLKKLQDLQKHY